MSILKNTLGAAAILLASATAASAFLATSTANLNVRSGPGTGYNVIDHLRPGETVEVTGRSGSWYRLEGGGWASANYLARGGGYVEREVYIDRGPYYYDYYRRPHIGFGFGFGFDRPRHWHHRHHRHWRHHHRRRHR